MTLTSGLRALIAIRADSTLRSPIRSVVWTIWRWRLREVDDVEVDEADGPDAGRREIQRGRRTEPAGADEQRLGGEQLGLAGRADLRDQQVAAVALLLLGGQDDRGLEVEARALPALEPAVHRLDVGVAHVGEGLGREQRAHAAGAVQDHRRVAVRAPRPRSAARCRTWRCAGRRGCSPAPIRTPRGRRRSWPRPAGGRRPPGVRLRRSGRGPRGGGRRRTSAWGGSGSGGSTGWLARGGQGGWAEGQGWPVAAAGDQAGSLHLQRRSILVMPGPPGGLRRWPDRRRRGPSARAGGSRGSASRT